MKYLWLIFVSSITMAALPPTTSKLSTDSTNVTTFNYLFPYFSGTHSGTSVSLGTLSPAGGGTGASSYTAPIGNISPILYWNGTSFATDSNPLHLGYDVVADTVYTSAINISGTTTQTAKFTNTGAQSSTGGAGMIGLADPGAAITSGSRLGFYTLGGSTDSSHTTNNSTAITSFSTENWSSSAAGAGLRFEVTANTTTTRTAAMTISNAGYVGIGSIDPTSYVFDIPSRTAVTSGAAPGIRLTAANALSAGNGGPISITAGNATSTTNAQGGSITLTGGNGTFTSGGGGNAGLGGSITLTGGTGGNNKAGGGVNFIGGAGTGSGNGGTINFTAGSSGTSGTSGSINMSNPNSTEGNGSGISFTAGNAGSLGSTDHNGGGITFQGGTSINNGIGGNVSITAGFSGGTGIGGTLTLSGGGNTAGLASGGPVVIQAGYNTSSYAPISLNASGGFVGIGTTSPTSTLTNAGTYGASTGSQTFSGGVAGVEYIYADATSGAINASLPICDTTIPGRVIHIKKIDSSANAVNITRQSTDLIDGLTVLPITVQWRSYTVVCATPGKWYVY